MFIRSFSFASILSPSNFIPLLVFFLFLFISMYTNDNCTFSRKKKTPINNLTINHRWYEFSWFTVSRNNTGSICGTRDIFKDARLFKRETSAKRCRDVKRVVLKRVEANCSEVGRGEVRGREVRWGEVKWDEVKRGRVSLGEMRWGEVRYSAVRWVEVKWGEV